jgi:serine/threonine protein kinase
MPAPTCTRDFLDLVRQSELIPADRLEAFQHAAAAAGLALDHPQAVAAHMVRDGLLTTFQAKQILLGKCRRFLIGGKYKLLELIGAGGMGAVYLCAHVFMHRRVAIKVLPVVRLQDPTALDRFYREARAAAALDHPNVVRVYDLDRDGEVHFLVMEFIDGTSLQDIVSRHGPMDPARVAHYIRQAAIGLQHAHEAGLVHRDIKPGNVLLDRSGTVKVLDLGLARTFVAGPKTTGDAPDDGTVLGTADYLSPEQAKRNPADVRSDLYSLGATAYFLLTGRAPFEDGTIAQKVLWHQTKQPRPIRELRADLPEGLAAVVERLMAKDPADRHQSPADLAAALAPWTTTPIPKPPPEEMPTYAPAALDPWSLGPGSPAALAAALDAPTFAVVPIPVPGKRPATAPEPVAGRETRPLDGQTRDDEPPLTAPPAPDGAATLSGAAPTARSASRTLQMSAALAVTALLAAGAAWALTR